MWERVAYNRKLLYLCTTQALFVYMILCHTIRWNAHYFFLCCCCFYCLSAFARYLLFTNNINRITFNRIPIKTKWIESIFFSIRSILCMFWWPCRCLQWPERNEKNNQKAKIAKWKEYQHHWIELQVGKSDHFT